MKLINLIKDSIKAAIALAQLPFSYYSYKARMNKYRQQFNAGKSMSK